MTRLSVSELRQAAHGRWPDILTTLGMPADSLTKANKPCPACGGSDRFSFTDKHGSGSFVCRAMDRQGGDGFELSMHWLGCDFRATLEAVARALGTAPTQPPPQRPPAPQSAAARRRDTGAALRELWRQARPVEAADPVGRYLASRGLRLPAFPLVLRCHPALPYWHTRHGHPLRLGQYPAMLAAVQGKDGRVVALHRTYLTVDGAKASPLDPDTGQPLPVKKLTTRGEQVMPGAAVRLYPPAGGRLALAEGIETGLAVHLSGAVPVWSCVTAYGMSAVVLPPEVETVTIAADNDANGTGLRAALALEARLKREGRRVEILAPTSPGLDWLDVLNLCEECTT